MKTVTFYSYKGGVGRSLALSNIANRFSEFGKKVCIMDFDLEAPGLHLKFDSGIKGGIKKGLVDYIYDFSTHSKIPKSINNYVTEIKFKQKNRQTNISLIAAGNTLIKDYWIKLSEINWNKLFYHENSLGVDFFYNLKEQIKAQINPDILLIDSRTGITDISGITMSIMADEIVLFGANNKENLQGLSQVIKTLAIPSNSIGNKIPKIHFVLSRIPYSHLAKDKSKESNIKNTARRIINQELKKTKIDNFQIEKVLVIHSDSELELEEKFKMGYKTEVSENAINSPIGLDYLNLFEELTKDIITKADKETFNNYIEVEILIEKAIASNKKSEKILLLDRALKIDPSSATAYYQLGLTYFNSKEYQSALKAFDKSLLGNQKTDIDINTYRAMCYKSLKKYTETKTILNNILTQDPYSYPALINLGEVYYAEGKYEEALRELQKIIELYPDDELILNNYGNQLRVLGRYEEALNYIYKALEIDPQDKLATGTLAEIYAALGNKREFYKNIELVFSFGMDNETFQEILETDKTYKPFYNDERFLSILKKYNINIDWSKVK